MSFHHFANLKLRTRLTIITKLKILLANQVMVGNRFHIFSPFQKSPNIVDGELGYDLRALYTGCIKKLIRFEFALDFAKSSCYQVCGIYTIMEINS